MTDKLIKLSSGSDNRTIFQVNDTEATQLRSIVSNAMEPARSWAQNLLEINGRSFCHEQVLIPDSLKSAVAEPKRLNGNEKIQTGNKLRVYPNPARQFVVIDFNLGIQSTASGTWQISLICIDQGIPLAVRPIATTSRQELLDTRGYSPGGYLAVLSEKGKVTEVVKIFLNP